MFNLVKPAYAQINFNDLTPAGWKVRPGMNIGELLTVTNIITFVFFLAGAIFLFSLLNAAWTYVTSSGDPKKIAEATQRILNAFFGIVIVLASFVIIRIILAVLGLPGLI
ncbi:MAG TPA: hypothetical protein VI791_01730 [Patescibacteria group bacterium]|nr:MAG: hypothetical protein UY37_C0011G0013 [Candidatus Beckwithbacteria bacterium GW2011_GWC2_49_11]HLE49843.1 hypothetical protein [Patescibacteria group bacterium]